MADDQDADCSSKNHKCAGKKIITQMLRERKIKDGIREAYLGGKGLKHVPDVGQMKNLSVLWLNDNLIARISGLGVNYRLAELYLQNNQLKEITGALEHLTCLRVLMLHNNQLEKLDRVVNELRKMDTLLVLNLFNNPVAQESEYRVYVIHHLPSVQLLDRHAVQQHEHERGRLMYDQVREGIKATVAFTRRSEGPPVLYYPGDQPARKPTLPADFEVGNNFYRDNPPYASDEQALAARFMRRSVKEFSYFDWSKVPRADERRLTGVRFKPPQIITTQFR